MIVFMLVCALAVSGRAEVGFYPDVATATIRLPDIYIRVAEWKHTFILDPPCHDSTVLLGHIKSTRDSVIKLKDTLSTPLVLGGTLGMNTRNAQKVTLSQMVQFSMIILSRLDRCEKTLLDRTTNAETLWGWSTTSLCAPVADKVRTRRSAQDYSVGDPEPTAQVVDKAHHQAKPSFYGASIGQVFVQADARRADNRYIAGGGINPLIGTFEASIREQELLRLQNTRDYYQGLRSRSEIRQGYRPKSLLAQTRGDNLPYLNYDMEDQNGNKYRILGSPSEGVSHHFNNVNFGPRNDMTGSPLRATTTQEENVERRRMRRGLDFIGNFYHWFAGIATDEQIRDVLTLIQKYEGQLNATGNYVETNARAIQSVSRTVSEEFESLAKIITTTQESLRQSTKVLDENLAVLSNSIQANTATEEITQALLQTLAELTECDAKTSLLENSLLTSAEFYLYVSDGMVSGNLPLPLVHTSRVVEVMKKITGSLPDRLAIPPSVLYDDMLSHIPVKMGAQNGKVIMVMTIPIIRKPARYQTLEIVSHPMVIGGFWYKVRIPQSIYLIDESSGEWVSMSKEDYQHCSRAPYGTCHLPHVWSTNKERDCGAHLVLKGDRVREVCYMDAVHDNKREQVFIAPIGVDTWLITHNMPSLDLTLTCRNGTKSNQETRSIKSQTRLILPANCCGRVDGYLLEPSQEILDAVKSESLVGDKYIFGELPELTIDTVSFETEAPASKKVRRAHEILNMTAPQVTGHVASLSQILKSVDDANKTYHSEVEMLAAGINELKEKIAKDSEAGIGWPDLFGKWWMWIVWVLVVFAIIILLAISVKVVTRSWCAPAVLSAAHIPLKGFAMPIATNASHVATVVFDLRSTGPPPANASLTNLTEIRELTQYVTHLTHPSLHYDILLAIIIMMVTIYWTKRFIMAEHRSMLARMGLFTRNNNVVHHMGESSLVIFFLAKSSSMCGRSHRVFEIPMELCTLPGQAMAWVCHPANGYQPILSRSVTVYRYHPTVTIKLDFSNLSISSAEFPGLSGSQNIPTKVSTNMNHLNHIISHHARWDWTSITFISVTGLAISFPGTFRYIYHYHKATSDRRSAYLPPDDA